MPLPENVLLIRVSPDDGIGVGMLLELTEDQKAVLLNMDAVSCVLAELESRTSKKWRLVHRPVILEVAENDAQDEN
jgi:hypothetical protein